MLAPLVIPFLINDKFDPCDPKPVKKIKQTKK